MLWALVVVLVVLWIGGLVLNLIGGMIHLLLVLAVLIALYTLFVRPRRAAERGGTRR